VYIFSFFIKRIPLKKSILPVCVASPLITYAFTRIIQFYYEQYKFGFELIIINTLITLLLLIVFSKSENRIEE